ncbi:SAM-dependent methyltransferase [Rhodococcus sp. NPDC060086]|uniref:SAM-dependent methyltransferase n=1 Tax=Rhodococcus sp. NPDC060086 TaxID=3347055 RepID=UPI003649BE10
MAFAIEVTDPQPGCSVLVIGSGTEAGVFAARVGPDVEVRVSGNLADATGENLADATGDNLADAAGHNLADAAGASDLVCAFGIPEFRDSDVSRLAGIPELLLPAGQLWVFDSPGEDDSAGSLSMRISTTLSHAGLAIVDILEGRCVIGLCAMVKG